MRKVNPEYAKAIMAIANRAPYLKLLGMKICELDYGYCRVETQINDSLNNPFASVHGGVFSSILDTATFWALYCCIGEEDPVNILPFFLWKEQSQKKEKFICTVTARQKMELLFWITLWMMMNTRSLQMHLTKC